MEKNNNNNATQYIRSRNMGNTIDNKQRNSKEEDAMRKTLSNHSIGEERRQSSSDTNNKNDMQENKG